MVPLFRLPAVSSRCIAISLLGILLSAPPLFAINVATNLAVNFPSENTQRFGPDGSGPMGDPLDTWGFKTGDGLTESFPSYGYFRADSSHWVFSMLDSTSSGVTCTFDVQINGVTVGNFQFTSAGGNQTHNFDLTFLHPGLIIGPDSFTLSLVATSTVPTGLGSWNGIPGGTVTLSGSPFACTPPPPNMVAWWRGDGSADDSNGAHNGSLVAGATFGTGEVAQAFSFDGASAEVAVPNSPVWNFGANDFTIDTWVEFNSFGGGGVGFVAHDESDSSRWMFWMDGYNLEFFINNGITGANINVPFSPNNGQWYHVAVTRSGGDTYKFYIDGAQTGGDVVNSTAIPNANVPLTLGKTRGFTSLDGFLDEVEIFNRALSASEIAKIFGAGPAGKCACTSAPGGMISWWPAEGAATDIQGGHNGSLQGGVTFVSGEVGQAFSFDGVSNAQVVVPSTTALEPAAITLDAWINVDPSVEPGGSYGIVGKYLAVSGERGYELFISNHKLVLQAGSTNQTSATSTGDVPFGRWIHVAATIDSTASHVYINGVLDGSGPGVPSIEASSQDFIIGAANGFFNGRIDEVEVFGRALGGDEIAAIYHAGSAGKCGCKIELNPEIPLSNFTPNGNDGYLDGRGTVFQANQGITITGAGLWTNPSGSDTYTYKLWEVTTYPGNVDNTLLATASGTLSGIGLAFYDVFFDSPVQLMPGHKYHVEVTFAGSLQQDFLYNFDSGNVNIGPVTVLDGTNAGSTDNALMPLIRLTTNCTTSAPAERQLANISTRAAVGTGDDVAIGGFIVRTDPAPGPGASRRTNGTSVATKKVLVRGLGPSLETGGNPVPGRLADPVLDLYDSNGTLIEHNDNWMEDANGDPDPARTAAIQATGLAPSDPNEAAILQALATNGGYTAILSGNGGSAGIGLVEIYDLEPTTDTHLANISTRGFVSSGDDVLIGGLIVQGSDSTQVVLRAIGPSLTGRGVTDALDDPTLELRDGNGALLESNDDWQSSPEAAAISASGLAPTDSRESAILFSPAPGGYTAIVSGKDPNPTGVALVEAFQVSSP